VISGCAIRGTSAIAQSSQSVSEPGRLRPLGYACLASSRRNRRSTGAFPSLISISS
jgi:hypothetical protein